MDTPKSNPCNQSTRTTTNQYARLEYYELIKPLNYGSSSKVKLGRNTLDNSEHVIKIIKKEFQEKYLNDDNKIKNFIYNAFEETHENVINRTNILPKAKYVKKNGKTKEVFAIILEYAPGGDLFECIKVTGNLKEEIARTYFQQLIETLDFLHSKGIAHRDLKPDNLLLGSDFKLKLSDFSLSSFIISENNGNQRSEPHLCTSHYAAPEIFEGTVTNPFALDIYTCGIILYIMVVGVPPFEKANSTDARYKMIMKHQFDLFWKNVERMIKVSPEFKSLISSMVCNDPAERLSISEVKAHPWYTGSIYSVDQLQEEYKSKEDQFNASRQEKLKEMQESKERVKKQKSMTNFDPVGKLAFHSYNPVSVTFRSLLDQINEQLKDNQEFSKLEKRESRDFVYTQFRGLNELVYNIDPELLFKIVMVLATMKFNTYTLHQSKLKVKGRIISEEFSGDIAIEVTKVDENFSCISFTRLKGSLSNYYKFIEEEVKKLVDSYLQKITQ